MYIEKIPREYEGHLQAKASNTLPSLVIDQRPYCKHKGGHMPRLANYIIP